MPTYTALPAVRRPVMHQSEAGARRDEPCDRALEGAPCAPRCEFWLLRFDASLVGCAAGEEEAGWRACVRRRGLSSRSGGAAVGAGAGHRDAELTRGVLPGSTTVASPATSGVLGEPRDATDGLGVPPLPPGVRPAPGRGVPVRPVPLPALRPELGGLACCSRPGPRVGEAFGCGLSHETFCSAPPVSS